MVKQPEQSYILWFTQHVGSKLIAQALEEFLRVPHARAMTIPQPAFEALADEVNDACTIGFWQIAAGLDSRRAT
jgi:hypothetical protein